jgi:hypothetical protein
VSTPPATIEKIAKQAPTMKMYQETRLSLGKATSLAPIIIGRRKLPSVVGIDGTRKNQTMTMPCSVNSRL